jgi:hypothetical protein
MVLAIGFTYVWRRRSTGGIVLRKMEQFSRAAVGSLMGVHIPAELVAIIAIRRKDGSTAPTVSLHSWRLAHIDAFAGAPL